VRFSTRPDPEPVGPGQESAWDYPRPPRVEPVPERLTVVLGSVTVADTTRGFRVLETSHPPNYYLPLSAYAEGVLRPVSGTTYCEWKGVAAYYDLVTPARTAERAGWTYPRPAPGFETMLDHVAVMPGAVDLCRIDGEVVVPQEGGFYGGWITSRVVGPFKGGPGSRGW